MSQPTLAEWRERITATLRGMTEHDARDLLYSPGDAFDMVAGWRWPREQWMCPSCGHDKYCVLSQRSLFQCNSCRRQTSVTAGTPFTATKIPLTKILYAAWVVVNADEIFDNGNVTAMFLHKALGISYNAAHRLRRKLFTLLRGDKT